MATESVQLQHINVKIYVEGDLKVEPGLFIDVFHGWVGNGVMPELLIDVADYRHVPDGPAVLLVGHEADYILDRTAGRWGLVYNRKAPLDGTDEERLRQALGAAASAALVLETQFTSEGLQFSRRQMQISINDRGLAPNTPETFDAVRPRLESFLEGALGQSDLTVSHEDEDLRRRFSVVVEAAQPYDLQELAQAISGVSS